MILKELARTGVRIPELGMGTSNFRAGPLLLRRGLEAGLLFIDTAESYGTEEVVGEALKGMRDRVFVATKVSPQNFRAADLRKSVDASLLRLGTDRVDLLQLHHPNPDIPIEEPMGAVSDLTDRGKVRYTGVSNFSISLLQDAQKALGKHSIVSTQVRYNLIDRTIEKDLLPYCQANGITVIAYTPLARGLDRVRDCDPDGILEHLARETGKSVAQIVLNWCLRHDRVVAIPMSNSVDHILEIGGASNWRLNGEHLALLDAKIQYRNRTRFDMLARRYLPAGLQRFALLTAKRLPRCLRRRFI